MSHSNEANGAKRVSQETLDSVVLFNDSIVRPLKLTGNVRLENAHAGRILKLPEERGPYRQLDGDEWKIHLPNKSAFEIGDIIIYNFRVKITLDGEHLDLVSYIIGKICEQNKT